MDHIAATRTSTGQIVEISVDDGLLVARTPDGAVLQSQPITSRRLKQKGETLRWSRVDYRVEDVAAAQRLIESLEAPKRNIRKVAIPAAILLIGMAIGVVGGVLLRDRSRDATCDTARAVVEASVANMEELNLAEVQDRSFFAAVIVEQRAVTYAMDAAPSCFPLAERAAAEGLLAGIRGLLTSASG